MDVGVILKRFDAPDEVREMPLGRFEVVRIGGGTVGRGPHPPGGGGGGGGGPGGGGGGGAGGRRGRGGGGGGAAGGAPRGGGGGPSGGRATCPTSGLSRTTVGW